MTCLNQDAHTDYSLKKINQIKRKQQALFQVSRSLIPSPPWAVVNVTVSHETLAEWWPSRFPFQRNWLHIELILLMQAFGRMKAEHQKVLIPAITVFMNSCLPANERVFTDQDENLFFICWIRGWQFGKESFLELRGSPKYQKGSVPLIMPVEAWIVSVSCSVKPDA